MKINPPRRNREHRGSGNSNLSANLAVESAVGLKTYQVWHNGVVVREIRANSWVEATAAANGLWITIKL